MGCPPCVTVHSLCYGRSQGPIFTPGLLLHFPWAVHWRAWPLLLDFVSTSLLLPELVFPTGADVQQEGIDTAHACVSFLLRSSASECSSWCSPRDTGSSKCRSFVESRNHPPNFLLSLGKLEGFCIVSELVRAAPLSPLLKYSIQLLPPWPLMTCSHPKLPK